MARTSKPAFGRRKAHFGHGDSEGWASNQHSNIARETIVVIDAIDREQAPVLQVSNVSSYDKRQVVDVSFNVYSGEILGFAGLVGSGRTELMNCLFGTMARASGKVELNGHDITDRKSVV